VIIKGWRNYDVRPTLIRKRKLCWKKSPVCIWFSYRISITDFENLPQEFFYEIFDYLDGCDIYKAFSNLNHRFQQLLNSSSLLFKIKFHSLSNKLYKNFYKQILALNKHQIFSLNLNSWLKKKPIFSHHFLSLYRLESFTLIEPDPNALM